MKVNVEPHIGPWPRLKDLDPKTGHLSRTLMCHFSQLHSVLVNKAAEKTTKRRIRKERQTKKSQHQWKASENEQERRMEMKVRVKSFKVLLRVE